MTVSDGRVCRPSASTSSAGTIQRCRERQAGAESRRFRLAA